MIKVYNVETGIQMHSCYSNKLPMASEIFIDNRVPFITHTYCLFPDIANKGWVNPTVRQTCALLEVQEKNCLSLLLTQMFGSDQSVILKNKEGSLS